MYSDEECDAILELKSFMMNDITEPAMRLIGKTFAQSCPFPYNIEFAIHHNAFMIIHPGRPMEPLDENEIWRYEAACQGDVLAFPVNCFEDVRRSCEIKEVPGGFGHANMIIVNRLLETVEHFDPHGDKMNDLNKTQQARFEKAVRTLFLQGPWADYLYLAPRRLCPNKGMQNLLIDHGLDERIKDSCRIWCFYYLMERLRFPERSAMDIHQSIMVRLKAGPLDQTLDDFIFGVMLDLYRAINVDFQHDSNTVCMQWPNSKRLYCVSRKRGSARRK
jgi:hypothetical protein